MSTHTPDDRDEPQDAVARPGDATGPDPLPIIRPARDVSPVVPPEKSLTAAFASTSRTGAWHVGAKTSVSALFGEVELDLREAIVEARLVELKIACVFSEVRVIAPSDWDVHVRGSVVLGENSHDRGEREPPSAPTRTLVVDAFSLLGEVVVKTRDVGEVEPTRREKRHRTRELKRRKNHGS